MRNYELVVVLSPMISPDEAGRTWERIKGFLDNREAEIVHEERWGTRRLAYPVRKGQYQFLEGNYCLARFATERAFNVELENYLKLDDQVLRSLVTATLPEDELAAHAAQTRAPRPPRPAPGMGPAAAPGDARPGGRPVPGQGAAPSAAPATAPGTAPANARPGGGPAPTQGAAPSAATPADESPTAPAADASAAATAPAPAADASAAATAPAPAADSAPPDSPQPEQPSE